MAELTVQDPDAIYQDFDRTLYKKAGDDPLFPDSMADNASSVTYPIEQLASGVDTTTTVSATGSFQSGKRTFNNTETGFILGVDPEDGYAKLYIGGSSQYLNWTGTSLVVKGSISASSIDIPDTATASSFHVDSSGNTWWGATTLAASTANVTAAGIATFAGLSSLNKKAYTNFESSGRFISTSGDSGSAAFGNQGVTIAPGTTTTGNGGFTKLLWDIANVFTNSPTFTATINMLSVGSGDARSFIGMGTPTVNGSGVTYSGNSQIGFKLDKTSGVVTLASEMNNGGTGTSVGTNITTVAQGDIVELFIKVTATSVKWYYRKNGGTLTLGDTQTTVIPTASGENNLTFGTSNAGSANNFQIILQCAAYEH